MIWSLQFSGRTLARVIRADGKPVTGYLDWLAAQALVEEHNRDIGGFASTGRAALTAALTALKNSVAS